MKVKVLKEFIDVHTEELHKVGDVMEITEERFAEIKKVNADLVKKVMEAQKKGK